MSYALIYTAKSSGKTSYWANPGFTSNAKRKYTWEKKQQIDFQALKKQYPTLFNNKIADRFEVLDLSNGQKTKVTKLTPQKQSDDTPKALKRSPYIIVKEDADHRRTYWSNSLKEFTATIVDQTSRWPKLPTAKANFKSLVNNDLYTKQLSGGVVMLWNVIQDQAIEQTTVSEKAALTVAKNLKPAPTKSNKPAKIKDNTPHAEMDRHYLEDPDQFDLRSDTMTDDDLPGVDLDEFDPKRVYEAIRLIIDALAQRDTVNAALKKYDGAVLQDYLHVLEFVTLNNLNVEEFTAAFQKNRRERRQIKDLSLLLNALHQSFDEKKFWNALNGTDSTSNQYHFRSGSTAEKLTALIHQDEDDPKPVEELGELVDEELDD